MIDGAAFLAYLRCGPNVEDLLELWPLRPDRLARALEAAGVVVDEPQAIKVWVRLDEQLAAAELRRIDVEEHPAIVAAALSAAVTPEPGLHVDEELAGRLPLLELAKDLARRSPCHRLAVERTSAGALGARGYFNRSPYAAVIVLADNLDGQELAEVFAHELAHGLDPDLHGIDGLGLEAFAEALWPLLLEAEPRTVAEAGFLVARALEESAGARRTRPASGTVASLLEWALADAGVLVMAVPETVAACSRRARDARRSSSSSSSSARGDGPIVRVAPVTGVPGPVGVIRGESAGPT